MWFYDAAKDVNTPVSILENLVEIEDCRLLLAGNLNVNNEILTRLADEKLQYQDKKFQRNVLWKVLEHPNASGELIRQILGWTKGVFDKPLNEVTDKFSEDSIKFGMPIIASGNPNTPIDILQGFLDSDDKRFWFSLLPNPALSLIKLLPYVERLLSIQFKNDWHDLSRVAENPNLEIKQLWELHNHSLWYVRDAVARHRNIDQDLIKKMLNDPDQTVRFGAMWNKNLSISTLEYIANQKYADISFMPHDEQMRYFEIFKKILNQNPNATTSLKAFVSEPNWYRDKV